MRIDGARGLLLQNARLVRANATDGCRLLVLRAAADAVMRNVLVDGQGHGGARGVLLSAGASLRVENSSFVRLSAFGTEFASRVSSRPVSGGGAFVVREGRFGRLGSLL